MTQPRSQQIDLSVTPYYHCICRCVRRAFLCGRDHFSGKDFEHRKAWVTERLQLLVKVFAIDLCAYAVMSNHYHLVIRVDTAKAEDWTDQQVVHRWQQLFNLPPLVQSYSKDQTTTEAEAIAAQTIIKTWRQRLQDISWFMRNLNEHLARKANQEDQCKGRFWEGRYKSQALLDEKAVLTCMAYVDLNPIRAGINPTPETSEYTSVQQRIQQRQQNSSTIADRPKLMPLVKQSQDPHKNSIGYTTRDYLELLDWSGRAILPHKRGAIPEHLPPILTRLNINPKSYLHHMQGRQKLSTPRMLGHTLVCRTHFNAYRSDLYAV
ncbi:MAG: transposase [Gammaproteobacteria bacterium]|nr:transposase [Gammaproteobacteria bacterium]MDH5730058.1 transposase [Gammaproteobacteria bacterium]